MILLLVLSLCVEFSACSNGTRLLSDRAVQSDTVGTVEEDLPVMYFPKAPKGLRRRRRRRDWGNPDISVTENDLGPFPKKIAAFRVTGDKGAVIFILRAPGVDEYPYNLFTVDRRSGALFVTRPLDREEEDRYILLVHAVAEGSGVTVEEPTEIIVNVVDANDNKPIFTQDTYMGQVSESSPRNFEVLQVKATDADEKGTPHAAVRYRIMSQEPRSPSDDMFTIDPFTGSIRLNATGLSREAQCSLEVEAADMKGAGLKGFTRVNLTVTDGNDHAPLYRQSQFSVTVPENEKGALVAKLSVTDEDDVLTPAWNARFTIVHGNEDGLFTVATCANKQEGIITTAKGLDFEAASEHTLLVAAENEVPFAEPLPTAIATVTVTVSDVNETATSEPAYDRDAPSITAEEACLNVDRDTGGSTLTLTLILILIPVSVVLNVTATVATVLCWRRTRRGRATGGGAAANSQSERDVRPGSEDIYENLNLEAVEPPYERILRTPRPTDN